MSLQILEEFSEITNLKPNWERLAELSAHPFGGYSFVDAWFRIGMPDAAKPLVFVDREDENSVSAILPAYEVGSSICLAGDTFWDYQDVITSDRSAAEKLVRQIFDWVDRNRPGKSLRFLKLSENGLLHSLLEEGGYPLVKRNYGPCPFVSIEGGLDAYLSSLTRKRRGDMRQAINRFAKKVSDYELKIYRGTEITSELLDEAIAFHQKHFNRSGDNSTEYHNIREFLELVAAGTSPQLHLSTLDVEGERVAVDFGFVSKQTYFGYLTTFDQKFGALRPGKVLILKRIDEWVEKDEVKTMDLMLGAESYKRYYTKDESYSIYRVTAFPRSVAGRLKHSAASLIYKIRPLAVKLYRKVKPSEFS